MNQQKNLKIEELYEQYKEGLKNLQQVIAKFYKDIESKDDVGAYKKLENLDFGLKDMNAIVDKIVSSLKQNTNKQESLFEYVTKGLKSLEEDEENLLPNYIIGDPDALKRQFEMSNVLSPGVEDVIDEIVKFNNRIWY